MLSHSPEEKTESQSGGMSDITQPGRTGAGVEPRTLRLNTARSSNICRMPGTFMYIVSRRPEMWVFLPHFAEGKTEAQSLVEAEPDGNRST